MLNLGGDPLKGSRPHILIAPLTNNVDGTITFITISINGLALKIFSILITGIAYDRQNYFRHPFHPHLRQQPLPLPCRVTAAALASL